MNSVTCAFWGIAALPANEGSLWVKQAKWPHNTIKTYIETMKNGHPYWQGNENAKVSKKG